MRRSADELKEDLRSGDLARVQAAIRELKERIDEGDEAPIPPLSVEIFDAFGDNPPEETQLDFVTVIVRYHSFVPPMSDREKQATLVGLVLRYAERYVAFEVAMNAKISRDPVDAVKTVVGEITRQGLASARSVRGARYLISRLLDGKDVVRRAVLEILRDWPADRPFQEVIEYVTPQLEPPELEFLKRRHADN